jgi:hypothetical protein
LQTLVDCADLCKESMLCLKLDAEEAGTFERRVFVSSEELKGNIDSFSKMLAAAVAK